MSINDVNNDLKSYIETNILPLYRLNDEGHQFGHIISVINRSFEIAKDIDNLNADIIYTAAAFHDIGSHIDRASHHIESGKILMKDEYINSYFNEEELNIIREAIEDHRASLKFSPRNIYGKILSSADRPIDIDDFIYRAYMAAKRNNCYKNNGIKSNHPLSKEELIEAVYEHLVDKFGSNGYAKVYFTDDKYNEFMRITQELINDKEKYLKRVKNIINL